MISYRHNPHLMVDGTRREHIPLKQVFTTPRPAIDDPRRNEYDAALRIILHLAMIMSGVLAVSIMTIAGANVFMTICAQALIPGAVQEVGDFKLHL